MNWGAGTSHRLLRKEDGRGFTVCHTIVHAGQEARLQYNNHLEACYCIDGSGQIEGMDGNVFPIQVGDIYVLNEHDEHFLRASPHEDLTLVSVFNLPLKGAEVHKLQDDGASGY